ncbi:MAG: DUF6285 domain-containing protein [Hyphomicrobiaceae bacterium]|nr:DUF6285 domain-containing protein [Hyphomicrobiaceae bacterium]
MTVLKLGAEALLDLVADAFKSEIAPSLPPDKRYLAAMMGNALEIARREIAVEEEALAFALLDYVYEDGDGTVEQLSRDIRSGAVNDATHCDLRKRLKAHLAVELKVRNPRFLAARSTRS